MPRAVSIHIGVNAPPGNSPRLNYSETSAWQMAELARQAGYDDIRVLRGRSATRGALLEALDHAIRTLTCSGDILFISFSGHGFVQRNPYCDGGWDEGWCLSDGNVLDNELAERWMRFQPGVRIVAVVESCYSAGSMRGRVSRGTPPGDEAQCISRPEADSQGIRASLLLLASSAEGRASTDGVYTRHLLAVWDEGRFPGSFCTLHRKIRARITDTGGPEPQILMLGAPDLDFQHARAFHLNASLSESAVPAPVAEPVSEPNRPVMRQPVYRDGGQSARAASAESRPALESTSDVPKTSFRGRPGRTP